MCEYCDKTETKVEKLGDDDLFPCEWISEESGPGACGEQAVYSVSDWFVDDHLCNAHKVAVEKEMEEGLGEFLETVGFHSQYEIKAIQQDETSDYTDSTGPDWKPCDKKASFAKYILDTSLLCEEHATEAQSSAEDA